MKKKINKKKPVTYAFIDSQNLNLGIQDQRWKLDFAKFRVYLKDKYHVSEAFLFIGYVAGNEALYTYLQKSGYVVIFKPTLERNEGKAVRTKGNVDAELILHSMIQFPSYDLAIIVAGDGDYHCLIEYLAEKKKLFKLMAPSRESLSSLLRRFGSYVIFVSDLKQKLQRTKKERY